MPRLVLLLPQKKIESLYPPLRNKFCKLQRVKDPRYKQAAKVIMCKTMIYMWLVKKYYKRGWICTLQRSWMQLKLASKQNIIISMLIWLVFSHLSKTDLIRWALAATVLLLLKFSQSFMTITLFLNCIQPQVFFFSNIDIFSLAMPFFMFPLFSP